MAGSVNDFAISVPDALPRLLLPWYDRGHRDLPWRKDTDPYHIWLSEIMLQQTRVEAVKGYYNRFLQAIPRISDLAEADDELLQKLWEGLGYYSRVRNLKKAAICICRDYEGRFPESYQEICALPGIGPYTAGAISSIAFNLPVAAVDGNVLRVISRITAEDTPVDQPAYKKAVDSALTAIYPQRAGDFTQALMELGATVCGPNKQPECDICPCRDICRGFLNGNPYAYPVRAAKKKRKEEKRTVFILSHEGRLALEKRPESGLLSGMWQFPNVPGYLEPAEAVRVLEQWGMGTREVLRQREKKHIFTHIQWDMRGLYLEVTEESSRFVWMEDAAIRETVALPTAFRQFVPEPPDSTA